ncbi:MAG TPA: MBL fold metallo-hydrolase [Propionibacterium sp.]|nr:MBL fold metallo-hydrolase [Propionibacterium sp.]
MEITSAVVGTMGNNAYLLTDAGEGLLIDAADDPLALLALIGDTPVNTIVTTHQHHDHVAALKAVAEHTGARLVAGAPDADAIEGTAGVAIDERVWDGDAVRVGNVELEVIGLVGHTPGSITLVHRSDDGRPTHLFVGDSLFPGGVGRTNTPEDFTSLLDDVTAKLFDRFADDTVVHPGHGDPTTLGAERPHLSEWRERGW